MMFFTDSPYERMMQQKPRYGDKPIPKPPRRKRPKDTIKLNKKDGEKQS